MKKKNKMTEKELTKNICNYLKYQYKDIIFTVDASGLKLSIGQSVQLKSLRSSRGLPDLLIFEPNRDYKGLFIELKKEGTKLYTFKKGRKPATIHLQEQFDLLGRLNVKGYYACFCRGFSDTKEVIDNYMKNR